MKDQVADRDLLRDLFISRRSGIGGTNGDHQLLHTLSYLSNFVFLSLRQVLLNKRGMTVVSYHVNKLRQLSLHD